MTATVGSSPSSNGHHESDEFEPGLEDWSFGAVWRDYRKVVVLGLLAGLIAFLGSFVVPPSYISGTRILIRARESTLLSATGNSLDGQPGVIDSQLSAVLSETEAAILTSRETAVAIVDRLGLAERDEGNGPIKFVVRNLGSAYLRTRAILAHGFYREEPRETRLIGRVQAGLGAKQIDNSYVLEVAAIWDDRDTSAEIANTAAELLIEFTGERYAIESAAYRDFLDQQVADAAMSEEEARLAVAAFQDRYGIIDFDEEQRLTTRSLQALEDQIDQLVASLQSSYAEIEQLESELSGVSRTVSSTERIETGRSETVIQSAQLNPTYTELSTRLQSLRAEAAGLEARREAIVAVRSSAVTFEAGNFSTREAQFRDLLIESDIARSALNRLSVELQDASVRAERPVVQMTRLDTAVPPTFPIGPKRYLYLAIGAFVGGLAGFVWSYLGVLKAQAAGAGPSRKPRDQATSEDGLDLTRRATPEPVVDLRDLPVPDRSLNRVPSAQPVREGHDDLFLSASLADFMDSIEYEGSQPNGPGSVD